jgi:multiple antibiotic resistance protein
MHTARFFLEAISVSFLALITVINPLGTGFTLNMLTDGITAKLRKTLARRIVVNSVVIFFAVLVFGKYILLFFGLSLPIIRVGGGALLATMGWSMLNSNQQRDEHKNVQDVASDGFLEKAFYPFTFPVTVGPGCIAVIFTLSAHRPLSNDLVGEVASIGGCFVGLVGVAVVVYFCYVYSFAIEKKLGQSGAQALNRLLAFITLCIGLQILWAGIQGLMSAGAA